MQVSIKAEHRNDFGKGAARRIRRGGNIPAVIYGEGAELVHIAIPAHDLDLALRKPRVVLSISFEGPTVLAKPRDIQRDPVKRTLEHVDLVVLNKAEAAERIEEGLAAEAAHEAAMNEKPSNEAMDLELHDDSAPVAEAGEDDAEA